MVHIYIYKCARVCIYLHYVHNVMCIAYCIVSCSLGILCILLTLCVIESCFTLSYWRNDGSLP